LLSEFSLQLIEWVMLKSLFYTPELKTIGFPFKFLEISKFNLKLNSRVSFMVKCVFRSWTSKKKWKKFHGINSPYSHFSFLPLFFTLSHLLILFLWIIILVYLNFEVEVKLVYTITSLDSTMWTTLDMLLISNRFILTNWNIEIISQSSSPVRISDSTIQRKIIYN